MEIGGIKINKSLLNSSGDLLKLLIPLAFIALILLMACSSSLNPPEPDDKRVPLDFTGWASYYSYDYFGGELHGTPTSDGGYVVAGDRQRVVKLSSDGEIEWQKMYWKKGELIWGGSFNSIIQTQNGGYLVGGQGYYGWFLILKLNQEGEIEWELGNGDSRLLCVQQTSDGGFITGGEPWIDDDSPYDFKDIYLSKLNCFGEIEWQKKYTHPEPMFFGSINQTHDGGFVVAGEIRTSSKRKIELLPKN